MKEGMVKKVKQDDGHTNGERQPHTDGVHKAGGEPGENTSSMEVERYELQCLLPGHNRRVYNKQITKTSEAIRPFCTGFMSETSGELFLATVGLTEVSSLSLSLSPSVSEAGFSRFLPPPKKRFTIMPKSYCCYTCLLL